jgi:hypothetical protein|tara:strand:+ start:106 stop:330 length:225 start_codon:yes stop_codon:yes gene_type:complete
MLYLIYDTEEDAYARADEEGKRLGYSYWTQGKGTRWSTKPDPTAEGKYALNVTTYDLTEEEQASTVSSYNPVTE